MRKGLVVIVAILGLLASLGTSAARADDTSLAIYPAAQCAAFWLARRDYALMSDYLDDDPDDDARAAAFRAAAIRLNGGDATAVDAAISEQRSFLVMLFDAFIEDGDRTSRDLHDRLLATCESFKAGQPETASLP